MKRKIFAFIVVLALLCSTVLGLVSCKKDKTTNTDDTKTAVDIKILPDMVDYGTPNYYKVNAINYSDTDKSNWITELTDKQTKERKYWIDDVINWDNDEYYTFGPVAKAYGESEEKRQSNIGYFDASGNWVTDESANTVERIFCYSEPADIIVRFSVAAIDRDKTDAIVKYIAREDPDREKGTGYTFTIGQSSAIEDYSQLEELQEIYDDFDAYKDDSSYAEPKFESEDDAYDALSLKQRKVYGEIFTIFGDDAAQFARAAITMCGYAVKIVETVMLPAYEEANGEITGDSDLENYMRDEMYDYETLSYLLAFREYTSLNANYMAEQKANAMSLYGYHYQYKHRDYNVFDDSVKKTYNGKEITEYEYFLKLSHKSYFTSENEALDYRDFDRRQYEQAYRYSISCYQKYYEKQLNFQALQEENDVTLYVGGYNNRFSSGIGYYNGSMSATGSSVTTYTKEMQQALEMGFESTLKLSDVNWEYTGSNQKTLAYNSANTEWNKLSDTEQENINQKIKKVRLELEQLKSQDYAINHATITNADLTKALKYQIKSYSADSVRGIQSNKKSEVIYYKDIDRFFAALGTDEDQFLGAASTPVYQKNAYAALVEDGGRNYAKYQNLVSNYSYTNVTSQITTADGANWEGVKSNIKDTLAVNYESYKPEDHNNIHVDEYFEDTLIRKTYSCGGDFDNCLDNNGHINCSKEYDTNWALSRLLDNHEIVLRYMYGQIEVTFYMLSAADVKDSNKFTNGASGSTSKDAVAGKWYGVTNYVVSSTKNVMSDEEIGSVCRTKYNATSESANWMNVPTYTDSAIKVSSSSNVNTLKVTKNSTEYTYTFIGWYVDENFLYPVILDEEIDYDIRLYPCYRMEK